MTDPGKEFLFQNDVIAEMISATVTGKIDVRHWQPPVVSEMETTATATV